MTTRDVATDADRDPNTDGRLRDEVKDYLLAQGADLVGFGSVVHMEGAPQIMQPRRYLPDAQSMIAVGLHINQASCDLIERSVRDGELPASYHSYQLFTLAIVNPTLDTIPCFKCGRHRECEIGGAYMMFGDAAKQLRVTKEMFARWEDDSGVAAAVDAAAEKLKNL